MYLMAVFLFIIANIIMCLQAQVPPAYPNNYNYNNYVTPTFSDLDVNLYTTPSTYTYGNSYVNPYIDPYKQVNYNKIRIWPFVIDQYLPHPYSNYDNYANNRLYQTYQTGYQQPFGKKK